VILAPMRQPTKGEQTPFTIYVPSEQ
jgi:hypothetical protein